MDKEMNYLSEKIDKLESSIYEVSRLAAQQSDYNYTLKKLRNEKQILENILNKLNEIALTKKLNEDGKRTKRLTD